MFIVETTEKRKKKNTWERLKKDAYSKSTGHKIQSNVIIGTPTLPIYTTPIHAHISF